VGTEGSHKANASHLSVIHGSNATGLAQPQGRLLDAHQVAELIGGVSADWVRRSVPGKISLGHSTKRWYEADLVRWIESRRTEG
jgi:predicted DNA-binding transcriptional regulator AlpA